MSLFISEAIALVDDQTKGNQYSLVVMLVVFGLIFYFIILGPQQKRAKERKRLIDSISKGDEILTAGGLIGRVTKISKTGYILIELNNNNEVTIRRDFISAVLPKGTIKSI